MLNFTEEMADSLSVIVPNIAYIKVFSHELLWLKKFEEYNLFSPFLNVREKHWYAR